MPARFFNPTLLPNGDLMVSGPFSSSDGLVLGDVQVRFLIIQKTERGRSDPPWMIDGVATCPNGGNTFEKIVPRNDLPSGLGAGDDVRGIGLAVAVKRFPPDAADPSSPPAPPAFETLTWCVDLTITAPTAA